MYFTINPRSVAMRASLVPFMNLTLMKIIFVLSSLANQGRDAPGASRFSSVCYYRFSCYDYPLPFFRVRGLQIAANGKQLNAKHYNTNRSHVHQQ